MNDLILIDSALILQRSVLVHCSVLKPPQLKNKQKLQTRRYVRCTLELIKVVASPYVQFNLIDLKVIMTNLAASMMHYTQSIQCRSAFLYYTGFLKFYGKISYLGKTSILDFPHIECLQWLNSHKCRLMFK